MSTNTTVYEDSFEITSILDRTYDRVTRIAGTSGNNDTSLTLDINSELYPLNNGDNVSLMIATTLNLDGSKDDGRGWRDTREESLADMWDYVCYGKVYKHQDAGEGGNIKVYISFGGLLLLLDGPYKKLSSLKQEYVYLLLKK